MWEWWVPGTGSHCHSKLPGLQPAPSPLQKITLGQGSSQKSGRLSYSGRTISLGWLVPQEICGWVRTYSCTRVCAASKTSVVCVPPMRCFQHIHVNRFGGVGGHGKLGGSSSPK